MDWQIAVLLLQDVGAVLVEPHPRRDLGGERDEAPRDQGGAGPVGAHGGDQLARPQVLAQDQEPGKRRDGGLEAHEDAEDVARHPPQRLGLQ